MKRRQFLRYMVAGSLMSLHGCGPPHATDEERIDWFHKNEADFVRKNQMALQETGVESVSDEFFRDLTCRAHRNPESIDGFSRQRWEIYRALFRSLRFDAGIDISGPDSRLLPNSVMMVANTAGI